MLALVLAACGETNEDTEAAGGSGGAAESTASCRAPHVASRRRSGKSTGNVLDVDGGVPAAYSR